MTPKAAVRQKTMYLIPPGGHTSCLALERMSSVKCPTRRHEAEEQGVTVTNSVRTRLSAWAYCPGPKQLHLPLGLMCNGFANQGRGRCDFYNGKTLWSAPL